MRVEIDDKSGFCFGVVRAIDKAERALADYGTVYSLGDIVHNRIEVQRLEGLGAAHGDARRSGRSGRPAALHPRPRRTPSTFARAREAGVEVIDATCPVVAKLQERVVKAHAEMAESGGQVVILGKRGHAEVVGLTGQVAAPTLVVEREEDLAQVDFTRPVYFLSQTTQSIALFERLADEMRRRAADASQVVVHDTICRQVANREGHLAAFARRFDAVIFVSGRKSSNGKVLCEVCRAANARTYQVEEAAELRAEWFEGPSRWGSAAPRRRPAG